ncbi:MAG: fibronectin type III domain-containing protein [Saprospiraceae bacterium]
MSINFLRLIAILVIFISWINVASAKIVRLRCMWRDDPATTMVIGWDQVSGGAPILYYGEKDMERNVAAYPYSKKPDRVLIAKEMNNHFVRLSGLKPNTRYYFVIQDSEGVSISFSFRTAPNSPDQRLSIIAGGDSRNHKEARCNANALVGKLKPHCVMFGGDMTADDSSTSWKEWFDDWQYTMGTQRQLVPIIPTRGNHEASNASIADLFDVSSSEVYYSLTLGGNLLKIYTLNTLIPSGGNQKSWLESDLKNSDNITWKFAQYHHTIRPHTASKPEKDELIINWATLFHKYAMNLVVESDAHVVKTTYPIRPSNEAGSDEGFIRDDKTGTVYVGEGCWGAPLRDNNDDKSWTRASGKFNQFKWIFVDKEKVEVRTVMIDCSPRVVPLKEDNIFFTQCQGLQLWNPPTGEVVILKPRPKIAPVASTLRPAANGLVSINFKLSQAANVQAILSNKQQQELATVPYDGLSAGDHTKSLNVAKVPAGEYIISIKANGAIIQRYALIR